MKMGFAVFILSVLLLYPSCFAQVQENFFGLHHNKYRQGEPWPTVPFGVLRTVSGLVKWADLESCPGGSDPKNSCYHWGRNPAGGDLDKLVNGANEHHEEVMFSIHATPDWLSTRGSRCRGAGVPDKNCLGPTDNECGTRAIGSCDPPYDLDAVVGSGEGDGPDKMFKDFVTAAATRYGKKIKYWELWNETSNILMANPKYWTPKQWARLSKDLHDVVKSIDPDAIVLGANICRCTPPGSAKFEPWTEDYFSALDKYGPSVVDGIGYHGYANPPERALEFVNTLKRKMNDHVSTRNKPIYNTESAWPGNHQLFKADQTPDWDARSAWLARANILTAALGAKTFIFFGWDLGPNSGSMWFPERTFGCTIPNKNGEPGFLCPTALAYEQIRSWLLGAVFEKECSAKDQSSGRLWTCDFTKNNGSYRGRFVWYDGDGSTTNYTPEKQFAGKKDLDGSTAALKPNSAIAVGKAPVLLEAK
ncbi:MAG TPA: hypothetical protein VN948_15650 [Terriglobales bacterium]|nr:hypothetical protein [Terriglobales bacterium]